MKLQDVIINDIYELNCKKAEELKERLGNKKSAGTSWAFCLGAGVSISCGLPDWTKLLAMLSGKLLLSYSDSSDKELLNIIGRAIGSIEKNESFMRKMNEAATGKAIDIYRNIDSLELAEYIGTLLRETAEIKDSGDLFDRNLSEYIRECYGDECVVDHKIKGYNNSVLQAVVEVMKKREIKRAITYNYDNLLEIALKLEGNGVETILPGDQKEFAENDNVYRVYHCHGLVPVDKMTGYRANKIILTETSYYSEERNNYSLSNVLQAYSMNYCNLLYIGFSGADYTFRRIIRGLDREGNKIKHNIFFSADDIVNMVYAGRENKKLAREEFVEQIKDRENKEYDYERLIINQILVSKTLYWEEKGMNVIWSTWEELPHMLKNLC